MKYAYEQTNQYLITSYWQTGELVIHDGRV